MAIPENKSLFTNLLSDPIKARDIGAVGKAWLRKQADKVRELPRFSNFLSQGGIKYAAAPTVGSMFIFHYNPKLKDKLPYYDTLPLIVCLAVEGNSMLGINFHYLPPGLRARLLDAFYRTAVGSITNPNARFNVDYQVIKAIAGNALIKPTIKRYLFSHVESQFIKIPPAEWDIAVFLPWATWQGSPSHELVHSRLGSKRGR